jgi:hypothetical protein
MEYRFGTGGIPGSHMILVKLSAEEEALAVRAGKGRQARRKQAGVEKDHRSLCDNTELGHIQGVLGELVIAKLLGVEWRETLYEKDECDFKELGIEARLRTRHWYDLFLWPDDKADRLWFLITKEPAGDYQVHGCILGSDAKKPEFWRIVKDGNPPSYFVPRDNENFFPAENFMERWKAIH